MKIFVCSPPGRGDAGRSFDERVQRHIEYLEVNGHQVVTLKSPEVDRHTSEESSVAALLMMATVDEVQIAWDGRDFSVLFFLGMAFALGKSVRRVPFLTPCAADDGPKSFARLMQWMDGNEWWKKINVTVVENKRKEQEQRREIV